MSVIVARMRADQGRRDVRPLPVRVCTDGCWTDVWLGDVWVATAPTREAALAVTRDLVETVLADVQGLFAEED